jgi:hypothetical protein
MFEVFFDLHKCRQLDFCVHVPSLNNLSDTNKLTIDEFAKDMSDAAEDIIKTRYSKMFSRTLP